jgi:pectate lyase
VTICWSTFYFLKPDSHSYAHLIGNSDGAISDRGKLHVTLHHNWYSSGVRGRMPRVRYGKVHLYNNYYSNPDSNYCVGVGVEANIRMENMVFEDAEDPWADYGGSENGRIGWANLEFINCSPPDFVPNAFPVFEPPYEYLMHPLDEVKPVVMDGAGIKRTP